MSGHSKWSTIKRQKGAADIKRGMTFTKIANAITIAARLGGSADPNANPRLRVALETARAANMPKENVGRAIDRGLGKLPGQTLEEVTFEGFGPAKVGYLVEALTDNKLRTLQEIRNLFERSGGNLGSSGSTAYLFKQVGEIKVVSKGGSSDDEMLELIDLGAEEVEDFLESFDETLGKGMQKYLVYVSSPELNTMNSKITQAGYRVDESALVYKPTIFVEINDQEAAKRVLEFSEKLEEQDDVQKVYANFDIAEKLI